MKNRKLKLGIKILLICIVSFFFFIVLFTTKYFASLNPVSKSDTTSVEFTISPGTPTSVFISNLESAGLIQNAFSLKIYAKLHPGIPKAGRYIFNKSLSAKEIYKMIIDGKVTFDTTWITFKEGNRLTDLAKEISNNFEYTYDEVMNKLDDKEYIQSLISEYSFLTNDILKPGIYHPLEGYLFPDTYEFMSDATLEYMISTMLNETESKLSKYKNDIDKSSYSIHEILTLASLIEMEAVDDEDRPIVAGVFYNRLSDGWTLGSDVTTYYGAGKEMGENIDAYLNDCNPYNTRGYCVSGLPIGPISSSGIKSIEAAIYPSNTNYYYFVADKYGKLYFNETNAGHNQTVEDLYANGLWQ